MATTVSFRATGKPSSRQRMICSEETWTRMGLLTVNDVVEMVNIVLGKTSEYDLGVADLNDSGTVTIEDVTELVNIVLGKSATSVVTPQD